MEPVCRLRRFVRGEGFRGALGHARILSYPTTNDSAWSAIGVMTP
jgi:hypothetical protein